MIDSSPANKTAIIGFVFAIAAIFLFWIPIVGALWCLTALILGIVSVCGERKKAKGLGIAALVLGAVLLIASVSTTGMLVYKYKTGVFNYEVEPNLVCNSPYITYGEKCCLDTDTNNVCDEQEGVKLELEEEETEVEEEITEEPIEEETTEEVVVEEETEPVEELVPIVIPVVDEDEPTIEELMAEYATMVTEEDFKYTALEAYPIRQTASIGDEVVVLVRGENKYHGEDPHYFKVSVRGYALEWVTNADETYSGVYYIGPIETNEEYFDIPLVLKIDDTYGGYAVKDTEEGENYGFSLLLSEADSLDRSYNTEKGGASSFTIEIE